MDFGQLPKSAVELMAALTIVVNSSLAPGSLPSSDPDLQYPSVISSYNLPSEVIVDSSTTEESQSLKPSPEGADVKLETVTRENDSEGEIKNLVTVEQPPVIYTVVEPTPKPSTSPTKEDGEDIKIPELQLIKEVKAETVSPSPSSSPSPSPSTAPAPTGDANSEKLFQMVNDYRARLSLKAFEKDERLCSIARDRAPQVNGELASGQLHKGFKALNLPYWATENIAAYSTVEQNFNFWISDYIHKKAIESDHKYSCMACSGASCSQIFSSFVAK